MKKRNSKKNCKKCTKPIKQKEQSFKCCKHNYCKCCMKGCRVNKLNCGTCQKNLYQTLIKKKYYKQSVYNCSICYNPISTIGCIKECKHRFCLSCIKQWSQFKQTCPECRKEFKQIIEFRHRLSRKHSKKINSKPIVHKIKQVPQQQQANITLGSPILIPLNFLLGESSIYIEIEPPSIYLIYEQWL